MRTVLVHLAEIPLEHRLNELVFSHMIANNKASQVYRDLNNIYEHAFRKFKINMMDLTTDTYTASVKKN